MYNLNFEGSYSTDQSFCNYAEILKDCAHETHMKTDKYKYKIQTVL